MIITDDMLQFLKISQRLAGTNLLLTDMERTLIEINDNGEIDYSERRLSDDLKKSGLTETVIRNGNEVIQLFENEMAISTETIAIINHNNKQIGFLVYYSFKGEFFYKDIEFANTAKFFIEKFANMQAEED